MAYLIVNNGEIGGLVHEVPGMDMGIELEKFKVAIDVPLPEDYHERDHQLVAQQCGCDPDTFTEAFVHYMHKRRHCLKVLPTIFDCGEQDGLLRNQRREDAGPCDRNSGRSVTNPPTHRTVGKEKVQGEGNLHQHRVP
jgi:hypothetical protein